MKMEKSQTFERRDFASPAIYPVRREVRAWRDESTPYAGARADATPFPLTRIFQPYEYWTSGRQDAQFVTSAPERDPPRSAWPAAPPLAAVRWLWRWVIRQRVIFRAP
jgi:hypothetical protein